MDSLTSSLVSNSSLSFTQTNQRYNIKYFFLLTLRQPTQDAPEELRARDFRRELEERERAAARDKTRERGPRGWLSINIGLYVFLYCIPACVSCQIFHFVILILRHETLIQNTLLAAVFPEHTTSSSSSSSSSKRPRLDQIPAANLDADDPLTDVRACFATRSG